MKFLEELKILIYGALASTKLGEGLYNLLQSHNQHDARISTLETEVAALKRELLISKAVGKATRLN